MRFVACAALVGVLAVTVGSSAGTGSGEWVMSLKGVQGVTARMSPDRLRSTWHVPLPIVYITRGSSTEGVGLVCHGRQRGTAFIFGDEMLAVWFRSGVRTDTGIRIGSLRSMLLAAYASRLERHTRDYDVLYVVTARSAPPRPALGFVVGDGRVRAIGYGLDANLGSAEYFGVDCRS